MGQANDITQLDITSPLPQSVSLSTCHCYGLKSTNKYLCAFIQYLSARAKRSFQAVQFLLGREMQLLFSNGRAQYLHFGNRKQSSHDLKQWFKSLEMLYTLLSEGIKLFFKQMITNHTLLPIPQ